MLIGIDASRANKPMKTGVEWYSWQLIQELKKITVDDPHSWLMYTKTPLQDGLEMRPKNWFEVRASWPLPYGWTQVRLSWELWRRHVDVLFLPASTMPRFTPRQTVVTQHDIGFTRLPQLYKKRQVVIHTQAMKDLKRRAARIITVSEFSKQELVDLYQIDPQKIFVTPLGIDHERYRPLTDRQSVNDCLASHQIPTPFFLVIGRLEAKKNLVTLIRAFTEFKRRQGIGDPHHLVLVGMPGYGIEEIRAEIKRSAVAESIHECGYVSERDLPALLNAAEALIHPSWYEGFGLPPIQAMACGCPVLSSSAASLPEVVGEAGLFFDPAQPEQMIAAMQKIISDLTTREALRTEGIRRAQTFRWSRTAELTLPFLTDWT